MTKFEVGERAEDGNSLACSLVCSSDRKRGRQMPPTPSLPIRLGIPRLGIRDYPVLPTNNVDKVKSKIVAICL